MNTIIYDISNENKSLDYEKKEDEDDDDEKDEDDDDDDDNYTIKTTNVCKRLSEILEIPPLEFDEKVDIVIPKQHGLSNADVIIPNYYIKDYNKIIDIDYYDIIKDDIRNCRKLNKYQLKYILDLQDEYKDELLVLFYNCINSFNDIMENLNC
jgi:hypothetical protein